MRRKKLGVGGEKGEGETGNFEKEHVMQGRLYHSRYRYQMASRTKSELY